MIEQRDAEILQIVETTYRAEGGGTWITRRAEIDWSEPVLGALTGQLPSATRPWTVTVDGELLTTLEVGTSWSRRTLELPAGGPLPHRLVLTTPGCDSPKAVGLNNDPRCSVDQGPGGRAASRSELFDLGVDRGARNDLSRTSRHAERRRPGGRTGRAFMGVGCARRWRRDLGEEDEAEALRALGYIE